MHTLLIAGVSLFLFLPQVFSQEISSSEFNQSLFLSTGENDPVIVVLGSSTAAGVGPTKSDSAWVNRYRKYVTGMNSFAKVLNLAVGGYTTYDIMPTGFKQPAGRPSPKVNNNITKALAYSPDAIIINLPSNDATNGYTIAEQLSNYSVIDSLCREQSIPVWVATTQPRNLSVSGRQNLKTMRDSTFARYGSKAVDFWTDIANEDGTISSLYNSGDGIHLNNAAHRVLFNRVVAAGVWETITMVGINQDDTEQVRSFNLNQNYPNPFNGGTIIPVEVIKSGHLKLEVINILGQSVLVLADQIQIPGLIQFPFEPAIQLSGGLYFYRLTMGNQVAIRPMIYLR